MKIHTNKSGFTLIEIIVVLIIVGILAAVALPNLFSNIQKSKSAQALSNMESYKTTMESCLTINSGISAGTAPCTIGGQNLMTVVNGWTFSIWAGATTPLSGTTGAVQKSQGNYGSSTLTYTFVASDATGDTITLTRTPGGLWTCSSGSATAYTGVC